MNSKIKELAIKAGLNTVEFNPGGDRLVYFGVDLEQDERFEKFAKLIIQECIKILKETAEDVDNGNIFHDQELLNKFEERWSAGLYYGVEKIEEKLFLGLE